MPNNNEVVEKRVEARFVIKSVNDATGEFEGYASTYALDQDGERIAKGAWARTLSDSHSGGKVPILFNHDVNQVCGWNYEAREDEHGLWVRGKLALETEVGKKAYYFLKGALDAGARGGGLSVGFRVIKDHWEKDPQTKKDVRVFDECALMEYSVCVFQAQLQAYVTTVKGKVEGDMAQTYEINIASMSADEVYEAIKSAHPNFDDIADLFTKSGKTKRVAGEDLGPSCFAYVGDPNDPSTWHLPYKGFSTPEKNASHVRNALARANQADIPASAMPGVMAKLRAAAKEHGIQVSDDGKADMADINTKIMTTSDAPSSPDFGEALAGRRRGRRLREHASDVDGALDDSLSAIHAQDGIEKSAKREMVRKAYADHGNAMADLHIKATGLTDHPDDGDESYGADVKAVLEALGTKGLDDSMLAWATKSKLPAAKRAALVHAMSLHNSAIAMHKKAMRVTKDAMDGTESDPNIGTDEMMSEDATDATNKSEEAANEVKALFDGFRGELNKLAS